jgi:hypothetical protein
VIRDGDAPERGEYVAGDHRAVAGVAEGDMTRTVTWCGNNFEAADYFAAGQARVRYCLHLRPAARQPALDDLTGENASVKLAHRYRDIRTEPVLKTVERADVVEMTVRECDPLDLAARLGGGCYQPIGGSGERRINEREAIVLANQLGVDRSKSGELQQVIAKLGDPHGSLIATPVFDPSRYVRDAGRWE